MPTATGKPSKYSTSKSASETAYEIMAMLSEYGATRQQMGWEHGEPVAVEFTMKAPVGGEIREVPVRLAPQVEALEERLEGVSGASPAKDVAWRQLKDLVNAQLEAAENGVREFHEIFMSDILVEASVGDRVQTMTVGQLLESGDGALPGDAAIPRLPGS